MKKLFLAFALLFMCGTASAEITELDNCDEVVMSGNMSSEQRQLCRIANALEKINYKMD